MPLTTGARLGPYEITGSLGAGGMGEVYRARDTRLDRDVAIKVLTELFATDPDRLARFEREARAVAALSHPGILAIHDFGRSGGVSYAVMELLEGSTLRSRLNSASLSPRRAVDFAAQVVRALAAAHEKGIVHRDVKPENVFITADGRVKLLDFGLARVDPFAAVSPSVAEALTRAATEPGLLLGTVTPFHDRRRPSACPNVNSMISAPPKVGVAESPSFSSFCGNE
jgi:serine/threonine protein kinase